MDNLVIKKPFELFGYPQENFDLKKYVESIQSPEYDMLFLLGNTGQGKSEFAKQFLFYKIIYNLNNNQKTKLYVVSSTNDARNQITGIVLILQMIFPKLKETWNTDECILTVFYTQKILDISADLSVLCEKNDKQLREVQTLYYFDDMTNQLNNRTDKVKQLFSDLASKARHYNVISIINSQKVKDVYEVVIKQIGTIAIAGKIAECEWDRLLSLGSFHSFTRKSGKDFYSKYFTRVNRANSRNIIILSCKSNTKCFSHKVPMACVNLSKFAHSLTEYEKPKK
jgi:hypothetical protein